MGQAVIRVPMFADAAHDNACGQYALSTTTHHSGDNLLSEATTSAKNANFLPQMAIICIDISVLIDI